MSYQVIARKWRPQTFEEVTGQEIITRTLRNAVENDRLHHAYLFSGARGVGKTTTARILAKVLNCHKTEGPNLTPCNPAASDACPSCIEIAEGRSIDVLEIDAASHTGIDDVRETIIENINFNPTRDRFRVFIIDEVHQLSKPAFNALLKTLEEPPSNVIFVMATTELHKVPDTILSRCQEFEFRTIPVQKIFDRLKFIADAEKIEIDESGLRELARSGTGSMRDAQSNFDQVISFSGDKITSTDVTNALGFAGVDVLTSVMTAIADKDKKQLLDVVDDMIARGHDLRNFCRDLLALFRDLLVFKIAGSGRTLETAVLSADQTRTIAEPFTEADLLRFFNSLCETEASLREAAHPRYMLEVGLVKLVEMRSVAGIENILERIGAIAGGTPIVAKTAAASTSATSEKKTLKAEVTDVAPAIDGPGSIGEPPFEKNIVEPEYFVPFVVETPLSRPAVSAEWISSVEARLPPIPSSDLAHTDDTRLDDGYENKLILTGDDLGPIVGIAELIDATFSPKRGSAAVHTGNAAAGAAPALDIRPETDDEPIEIPVLGPDPTEEDLQRYAEAHVNIRLAKRVFRARVVDVKRT